MKLKNFEEWFEMAFEMDFGFYQRLWAEKYGVETWKERHWELLLDYANYIEYLKRSKQ